MLGWPSAHAVRAVAGTTPAVVPRQPSGRGDVDQAFRDGRRPGSLARGWTGGHAPLLSAPALQQASSTHRKGEVRPAPLPFTNLRPRKRRPDAPCRKRHGEPGGSQIPGSVRDSRSAPEEMALPQSPGANEPAFPACITERRDGVEISTVDRNVPGVIRMLLGSAGCSGIE